jgi:hypothetical protein
MQTNKKHPQCKDLISYDFVLFADKQKFKKESKAAPNTKTMMDKCKLFNLFIKI